MHTKEEATTLLFCPATRGNCISDKCAMWRWGELNSVKKEAVVPAPELGSGGKRIAIREFNDPSRGFCGLAGKPTIFQ